jgi:hypothetical protein
MTAVLPRAAAYYRTGDKPAAIRLGILQHGSARQAQLCTPQPAQRPAPRPARHTSGPQYVCMADRLPTWTVAFANLDDDEVAFVPAVDVRALDAAMPFDFEHKAQARLTKAKQLTVGIVGFGTFGQFLARRLVQAGHKVGHSRALTPHSRVPHTYQMCVVCRRLLYCTAGLARRCPGQACCIKPVQVLATSRGDYSAEAARIGVDFCGDPDDFCEAHPDVVVLATSITSTVLRLRPAYGCGPHPAGPVSTLKQCSHADPQHASAQMQEAVLRSLPLTRLRRSTLFVDVLSVKLFPKTLFLSVLPKEVRCRQQTERPFALLHIVNTRS